MERFDFNNGCLSKSSAELLYNHSQKLYIKSKKEDEKSKILRVMMEVKSGLSISMGKVLSLQITDDNDCGFYYSLLLTQEDFALLKCQQGLLVDFDHFPTQLVKLLEACRSQEITKFILVLDEEDSDAQNICTQQSFSREYIYLKVIETNNFKNLCHLSLKIGKGSDSDIINHMSIKMANLNEDLLEKEKKLRISELNLSEATKNLESKTKEVTDLQIKLTEEKNSLKLEMNEQLTEEREKLTSLQLEWQQKLESEKFLLIKQYQKQINELNEQINLLTFNNKTLYEARCQLETSDKEKGFHLGALEKQILQLTQEVAHLKKQNSQMDKDYHERDKMIIELRTKLAVTEQELKDKKKFIEKQQELLKSANEQKSFLEEALNEKESHLQRKKLSVQNLSADLMKSNEIIAKLQTDLAANKAKMKLRTDIALEQERILEKKNQQIAAQTESLRSLEEKEGKLLEELNSAKTQLEEAQRKVEEKEVVIKKNDNVINWLNRRLTESSNSISTNSLPSNRTGSDTMFGQQKGNISNLTKGWPPWLVNSVVGSNSFRDDSLGMMTNTNSILRTSVSTTPLEISMDQNKIRIPRLDENNQPESESLKTESKLSSNEVQKSKGLDSKYFQNCTDKNFAQNPQILKVNNGKDNWSSSNCKSASRSTNGRQPNSAYFPKKPVPL